jgi:hypothetical protein
LISPLGLLLAAALPRSAYAYEDQLGLGAGAGYAYAARSDSSHHGAYFHLEASLGLSSTWSLRGTLGFGQHPSAARLSEGLLGVEALYLVDVLEFVPYAGIGVDALISFTRARDQFAIGAHPVLGIDWLLGRAFLLGMCARPIFVLSQLAHSPLYLTVSLTATWLVEL